MLSTCSGVHGFAHKSISFDGLACPLCIVLDLRADVLTGREILGHKPNEQERLLLHRVLTWLLRPRWLAGKRWLSDKREEK